MSKYAITILCLSLASLPGLSQIKINNNSKVVGAGVISTTAVITNSSPNVDFSQLELQLLGDNDQQIDTSQPMVLSALKVDQSGSTTLTGNLEVSGTIGLVNGIIRVGNSSTLLYSGSENPEGNSSSYIIGPLFRTAGGRILFPVGTPSGYLPVLIENFNGNEIGVSASDGDVALTLPEGVISYFTGHYWEFTDAPNSTVSLSLNGLDEFVSEGPPVVLGADAISSPATLLSGALSTGFVTSIDNVTQKIAAIGRTAEFKLIIHDMITPFTIDDKNDRLTIENIERVTENSVKLLDRWGVVVQQWENYSNDTEYDFSKLSPGNYICIVEFAYPGESRRATVKGIVTVLKSN